jgi:nucleoside-diphosphate-sugar epimerase
VTQRSADLADRDAAIAAAEGAEVVVMAAQVPYHRWYTELGDLFDNALQAAASAGARLVVVDNLYAYGSPGTPIGADSPEAAATRKGSLRRELGRRLLAAHDAGQAPVTIGRFADYYGGRGHSLVDELMVGPAVRGKRPRGFISLDQPHTFHYLGDAARGFARLVEEPAADGHVWVLPAAPPITQGDLLDLLARVLDRPLRPSRISPAMLWVAGLVDVRLREAREVVAQFDRPYVVDASAFEAAFGPIETTPHEQALRATVAALRSEAAAPV